MRSDSERPAQARADGGLEELAAFAVSLAERSGPLARRYFRSPLQVEQKADLSPVTVADRAIESDIRQAIAARFPHHGILGEEEGGAGLDHATVWVIDPIDGTKSFITGMPLFGTLIAAVVDGRPCVGVVDLPALGERWVGVAGVGTQLNGQPCRTSGTRALGDARLYCTSPDQFLGCDRAAFEALSAKVALRRFGGDCYAYGLLASGHVDLVVEAGLQPYDFMALVPVVEEAGGVISDWAGARLSLRSTGQVIAAANAVLHAAALAVVASWGPLDNGR